MMRYIILAMLVYIAYLVLKGIIRGFSEKTGSQNINGKKTRRSYDLDQVQDAEFREIKKE